MLPKPPLGGLLELGSSNLAGNRRPRFAAASVMFSAAGAPGMPLYALRYKWLHFSACAMGGAARGRCPNRGDDCA